MPYPVALPELVGTAVRLSIAQQTQIAPSQFSSDRDKDFCTAVRNSLSRSFGGLLSCRLLGLEEIEGCLGP